MTDAPKTILIADIDATDRLRPIDIDQVELIAASIEQKGLIQPIVVRPAFPMLAAKSKSFVLIVGAHRLAAMKLLGWTELVVGETVIVRETDELSAKIDEIDENLARHELNALDRAIFIAKRKQFYNERNEALGHGGNRKDKKFKERLKSQSLQLDFPERFTANAAKKIGLSERTIQLACRIAEKLDQEAIDAIRGTMVEDNQLELLALAALEPHQQRVATGFIKAGTARNVLQAKWAAGIEQQPKNDPQVRILDALMDQFGKASKGTRKKFMDTYRLVYAKNEDAE